MEKLASASFFVSCENCISARQGSITLVDSEQEKGIGSPGLCLLPNEKAGRFPARLFVVLRP
ncbi:MAG: hypothetical protein CMN04_07100 [Roseibacillus sp.]|nr:hypothetical protein [Roseibacillus sp.]